MKIFVFIPARLGSTRMPGKPLALIAGKSMIRRVYEQAAKSPLPETVYIATPDEEIARAVKEFGGQAVMTEPSHRSGSDRIAEAARSLGLAEDDIVVNLQGDQPLCPPALIGEAVAPLLADPTLEAATLGIIMPAAEAENPGNVKIVLDKEDFGLYFSRAIIPYPRDDDARPTFIKHHGVYAYRNRFLQEFASWPVGRLENLEKLEMLRILEQGRRIKVVLTYNDSLEVDCIEDVRRCEALLAEQSGRDR